MNETIVTTETQPAAGQARYRGNRTLAAYVASVVVVGIVLLLSRGRPGDLVSWTFLLWFLFSVGAELLWLQTPTGDATDSMASTFNVAVLYLFTNSLSLWIIGLSVFIATRFIQHRDWVKSFFGLGQMIITAFMAGSIYRIIAGGPAEMTHFNSIRGPAAFIVCCMGYFVVNTALVAGAVALENRARFWETLKENYLYRNQLTSNGTLFALSPILLLSYLSIGYAGVLLFFLPLVIIKEQNRTYIELQRATEMMISRERMAAKGEMAAAVAHEMNNYLAVLSGRTQLLQRKLAKKGLPEFDRDGEVLWTQIERLARLAKGLLQFSTPNPQVSRFDLNSLCEDTVEFLKPQNIFDQVVVELELAPDLGEVEADQGQIEQILQNLVRNAAQAMRGKGIENPRIRVKSERSGKDFVQVEVVDNGRGVPEELRPRVFEPGFTTKDDGHGFGLATCFRIMENHKGRIWVENHPDGGARFCFAWPGKKDDAKAPRAA